MTPHGPEEPLAESAPVAQRLARELCPEDTAPGDGCAWYHGFWQYLRLLGLATTGRMSFISGQLRLLARSGGCSRLLISGGADYAVAAHASWACRQEGVAATITMVDRCETPLALTRWYGERCGVAFKTHRSDILDFPGSSQYDVVAANCFLSYFDSPGRARLLERWASLLRPGGRLILTNRVRPGEGHARVRFTRDQAQAFVERVRAEAQRLRPALSLDPDEMAGLGRAYAEQFSSVPLRSTAELEALLGTAGFAIDYLDLAAETGPSGAAVRGPSLAEATGYAGVVATRR